MTAATGVSKSNPTGSGSIEGDGIGSSKDRTALINSTRKVAGDASKLKKIGQTGLALDNLVMLAARKAVLKR